jgi:hypothetical protein
MKLTFITFLNRDVGLGIFYRLCRQARVLSDIMLTTEIILRQRYLVLSEMYCTGQ